MVLNKVEGQNSQRRYNSSEYVSSNTEFAFENIYGMVSRENRVQNNKYVMCFF